jgi:type IV pilus assembly protein PilE
MKTRKIADTAAATILIKRLQCGFTLIEIMVAIVVIAIMASVALSSYQSSIIKTKRKAALSTLMTLVSEQEEYFVNNKGYATDLTSLGYAVTGAVADPLYINDNGDLSTSAAGSYSISFAVGASASAYTLAATPINGQTHDTQCSTLSINSVGTQTTSGTEAASSCFR